MYRDEVIDTWRCPSGSGRRYQLLRRTWPEGFSKPVLVEEGDNEHELSASMAKQILTAQLLEVVECTRWRDCKTDPPPTREVFSGEQQSCPVLVLHLGGGMHVERYRKNEDYDVEGYFTCDLDHRDTTGTAVFWRPLPMPHLELQERHAEWMES